MLLRYAHKSYAASGNYPLHRGWKPISGVSQIVRCNKSQTSPTKAKGFEERDHEDDILAAATLLSLSAGVAYAGDGEGPAANTQFTELPGVVAEAQVPNAPAYAQRGQATQQAQNGQGAHGYGIYSTQSSHGTWLFPPNANQGGNS